MFSPRRLALLFLFALGCCLVNAADEAAPEEPTANAPSSERIDELIKQLDADRYSDREDAMKELIAIGKPAIEPLTGAATAGSLEVTSRAIDVLKHLYESPDEASKTAAEQALKTLANGNHRPAARRAQEVLKPEPDTAQQALGVPRIVIGGAQFGIRGGNKNVSVRTVNGVKTIEVQEGDKRTKIVDDPKKGIEAEITTKKDGKEKTEKIQAKNADELKKKNKEVFDLYQQYSRNVGMAQIQIQMGNIRGKALPVPGRAIRRIQPQRGRIDMATRLLKLWTQQVARLTNDNDLKGATKESVDELQKQIDEAKRQIAALEKRIQARADVAEDKPEEQEEQKEQEEEAQ
jgi:hypothetical protein